MEYFPLYLFSAWQTTVKKVKEKDSNNEKADYKYVNKPPLNTTEGKSRRLIKWKANNHSARGSSNYKSRSTTARLNQW